MVAQMISQARRSVGVSTAPSQTDHARHRAKKAPMMSTQLRQK